MPDLPALLQSHGRPPLGEKHLKKLDLFVSLLSHPISCVGAGEQMGSLSTDIGKRVTAWRAWLL
ncbi:DUF746 domain-containing protein [Burkholderia pseudomallei]